MPDVASTSVGVKYKLRHQPLKMTWCSEVRINSSRKYTFIVILLYYGDFFYNAIFVVIITILYHIVVLYLQSYTLTEIINESFQFIKEKFVLYLQIVAWDQTDYFQ